jgi:hypothetical protein
MGVVWMTTPFSHRRKDVAVGCVYLRNSKDKAFPASETNLVFGVNGVNGVTDIIWVLGKVVLRTCLKLL